MLTLRRLFPDIAEAGAIAELATDSFTREKVGGELAYLERPLSRGFERPYGWGWLLYLHLEATRHSEGWATALEPLARPSRSGFAIISRSSLIRSASGPTSTPLLRWCWRSNGPSGSIARWPTSSASRSLHWFGADRDCQAWEPAATNFSPLR